MVKYRGFWLNVLFRGLFGDGINKSQNRNKSYTNFSVKFEEFG